MNFLILLALLLQPNAFAATVNLCDASEGSEAFSKKTTDRFLKRLNEAASEKKRILTVEELLAPYKEYKPEEIASLNITQLARDARSTFLDLEGDFRASREKLAMYFAKKFADFSTAKGSIDETEEQTLVNFSKAMGMSRDQMAEQFGDDGLFGELDDMINLSRARFPTKFETVTDGRKYTEERKRRLKDVLAKSEYLIILTIAEGNDFPIQRFHDAKALSRARGGAPIIILPPMGEVGTLPQELSFLFEDPKVHFLLDEITFLDPRTIIFNPQIPSKQQVNFEEIFQAIAQLYGPNKTIIVPHPSRKLVVGAAANYRFEPTIGVTTGTLTNTDYVGRYKTNQRSDMLATLRQKDQYSVLLVSRNFVDKRLQDMVGGEPAYGFRRVNYAPPLYGKHAGLYDAGKIYSSLGSYRPDFVAAMVLADTHHPKTRHQYIAATKDLATKMKFNKRVKNPAPGAPLWERGPVFLMNAIVHDAIEGGKLSHWDVDRLLAIAAKVAAGEVSALEEVRSASAFYNELQEILPGTVLNILVDNHGFERIVSWLQTGMKDMSGYDPDLVLFLNLLRDQINKGGSPYERIFEYCGLNMKNVRFIDKNSNLRVGYDPETQTLKNEVHGTGVGKHGYQGINGMRFISIKKLLQTTGSVAYGHTHALAEDGLAINVGTGTPIEQDYHTGGGSTSTAGIGIFYAEGVGQLFPLRRGKFLPDELEKFRLVRDPKSPYPIMENRTKPIGEQTVPQHGGSFTPFKGGNLGPN